MRANAAFDYRASRARVGRRQDRGEDVVVCAFCETEMDVKTPKHEPRCREWKG